MASGDDTFLFTSESVNEGHPDKLADQVGSVWVGRGRSQGVGVCSRLLVLPLSL